MTDGEDIELGGNIKLVGFKGISHSEMVVVKKMVGSYARKLSDGLKGIHELKVTLKPVHKTEGSEKFELHANVHADLGHYESEIVDRNLFVGLDSVLGKASEHALKDAEKKMK